MISRIFLLSISALIFTNMHALNTSNEKLNSNKSTEDPKTINNVNLQKKPAWSPLTPRNISKSMSDFTKLGLGYKLMSPNVLKGILETEQTAIKIIRSIESGELHSRGESSEDKLLILSKRDELLEIAEDFIHMIHNYRRQLKPIVICSLKERENIDLKSSPTIGFLGKSDKKSAVKFLMADSTTEENLKKMCIELVTIMSDIIESFPKAKKQFKALKKKAARLQILAT